MRAIRIIFLVVIVFLALPEFVLGVKSIAQGIQAHGDTWSVQHSYFTDAWVLVPDLLAIGLAAFAAFRPVKQNWVLFLMAAMIVLYLGATLPSWYYPPEARARTSTMTAMQSLKDSAEDWSAEHGVYPRNAGELERALKKAGFKRSSPFQRQSAPLDYQIVINADAHDPVTSSDRPGVLHYAVRANGLEYWITGTTLAAPISNNVIMVTEGSTGSPWILTDKLQPRTVVKVEPAPKKKK